MSKRPANDSREMTPEEMASEALRVRQYFGRLHIERVVREIVIEKLGAGYASGKLGRFG